MEFEFYQQFCNDRSAAGPAALSTTWQKTARAQLREPFGVEPDAEHGLRWRARPAHCVSIRNRKPSR